MHGHFTGALSDAELQATYRARDKQLVLTVESNCFLTYRPDLLAQTFPGSRYIIAVREPRSWLASIVDNNINFRRDKNDVLTQWHRVFFGESVQQGLPQDEALLKNEIFVGIAGRQIAGYRGIHLLRRDLGHEVEFVTVMWFASLEAVRAFAGEDYEVAVVPPKARALLSHFDARSQHYDVRAEVTV